MDYNKIGNSIILNYKAWFLFFVCSTILCDGSVFLGIVTFLYTYLVCYVGHYLMHVDFCYCHIYSLCHCNHHVNSEWAGFIVNCMTEYLALANNIVFKCLLDQFEMVYLFFINPWVVFFLYVLYTTVHNINYSIFKVNQYHVVHHAVPITNLGPDFYDLLFGTKNVNTDDNEQIDHYIPNIIFAFILVLLGKRLHKYYPETMNILFAASWIGCTSTATIFGLSKLIEQIQNI